MQKFMIEIYGNFQNLWIVKKSMKISKIYENLKNLWTVSCTVVLTAARTDASCSFLQDRSSSWRLVTAAWEAIMWVLKSPISGIKNGTKCVLMNQVIRSKKVTSSLALHPSPRHLASYFPNPFPLRWWRHLWTLP